MDNLNDVNDEQMRNLLDYVVAERLPEMIHDVDAWGSLIVNRRKPHTYRACLLYTSPSPRDRTRSRMPSSA